MAVTVSYSQERVASAILLKILAQRKWDEGET